MFVEDTNYCTHDICWRAWLISLKEEELEECQVRYNQVTEEEFQQRVLELYDAGDPLARRVLDGPYNPWKEAAELAAEKVAVLERELARICFYMSVRMDYGGERTVLEAYKEIDPRKIDEMMGVWDW